MTGLNPPEGIYPRLPSTKAWLSVYILLPLVPYLTACFVRLVGGAGLTWQAFDVKELAISMCLASVFVRQSLLNHDILLANAEKEDEVIGVAQTCWFPTAVFFALFILIEFSIALKGSDNSRHMEGPLLLLQICTLVFGAFFLYYFVRIQRSFKLKASLL